MLLINCEINLILTWSSTCAPGNSTGAGTFPITGTKIYAPAVTLSTQINVKLLQQLQFGLEITIKWNRYLSTVPTERFRLNRSELQEVNRLLILSLEDNANLARHT